MIYTLNQLHAKIKEFADGHLQLKGNYFLGELQEVSNQQVITWPYLFGVLDSSSLSNRSVKISISFIMMDQVHPDLSNRVEVWSDTLQILSDLRAWLNKPEFSDLFTVSDEMPITPFADRFTDNPTGWTMDVEFTITDLRDYCAIPMQS